jgi:hypothetical protein
MIGSWGGARYYHDKGCFESLVRDDGHILMAQQRLKNGTGSSAKPIAKLDAFARTAKHYSSIQAELEKRHRGCYVMISVKTLDYVIAPTASVTHTKFIEKFGESERGWCTRIEVSPFTTA